MPWRWPISYQSALWWPCHSQRQDSKADLCLLTFVCKSATSNTSTCCFSALDLQTQPYNFVFFIGTPSKQPSWVSKLSHVNIHFCGHREDEWQKHRFPGTSRSSSPRHTPTHVFCSITRRHKKIYRLHFPSHVSDNITQALIGAFSLTALQ